MARSRPVSLFSRYTHQALHDYSQGIHDALNGNALFPTPTVTLADQQTANDDYQGTITAWGPKGNRGSHAQHVALLQARAVVVSNIRILMGYVDGIANGDPAAIISAGMVINKSRTPQGVLQQPQNVHQFISRTLLPGQIRLKWKRCGALGSSGNVKGYNVYRSLDTNYSNATLVGEVTKTSFIETPVFTPYQPKIYYWVAGFNTAGLGAISDICEVNYAPIP